MPTSEVQEFPEVVAASASGDVLHSGAACVPAAAAVHLAARDARHARLLAQIRRDEPFWVFAYGSLLWRPEFSPVQSLAARIWGHHRALRMYSRVYRGTPEQPGLVFALIAGGSCKGRVLQVAPEEKEEVFEALWSREMVGHVYEPRWLHCQVDGQAQEPGCEAGRGSLRALAFTLRRDSPQHAGSLCESQVLGILHRARGRNGRSLDYLLETARALRAAGIHDREVERLFRLLHQHHLHEPQGS